MTPKEKAIELIDKMKLATDEFGYININKERHKQCALISVDEILNIDNIKPYILHKEIIKYYQEVKQEINNF